jgi:hypothetical protein
MPPGILKTFYLYLVVIVLFGWLGLAISDPSEKPPTPEQTKPKEDPDAIKNDFCALTKGDKYAGGIVPRIGRLLIDKVDGDTLEGLFDEIYAWGKELLDAVPAIGPVIKAVVNLFNGPDPVQRCLGQISEKLEEGFKNIENKIQEAKEEIINAIEKSHKEQLVSTTFSNYRQVVREKINSYVSTIQNLMNPKTATEKRYRDIGETCVDRVRGIEQLTTDFKYYLKTSCYQTRNSYNTKKVSSTNRPHTYQFDDCLAKLIKDAFGNNETIIRQKFMKSVALDGIRLSRILTYCVVMMENRTDEKEIEKFILPIQENIVEALESAENIIMYNEIKYMELMKQLFSDRIRKFHSSIKDRIKNPNFWITELDNDSLKHFFKLYKNASIVFADGKAEHRVLYCPKTLCFFIPDLHGMHVMYSESTKMDLASYNAPLNSIGDFYSDLEHVNAMINKSNPDSKHVLDEFVRLRPLKYSTDGFNSAALFYTNDTNLKIAFKKQLLQFYVNRQIVSEHGIVKVIAPSNTYCYDEFLEKHVKFGGSSTFELF